MPPRPRIPIESESSSGCEDEELEWQDRIDWAAYAPTRGLNPSLCPRTRILISMYATRLVTMDQCRACWIAVGDFPVDEQRVLDAMGAEEDAPRRSARHVVRSAAEECRDLAFASDVSDGTFLRKTKKLATDALGSSNLKPICLTAKVNKPKRQMRKVSQQGKSTYAVFIVVQSCTGVLGPSQLQAIIDDETEAKNKHDREHPFVCDFMVRKNVKCTFRGKTIGGLKVHAGSAHMWKQPEELKFTNASRVSSSSSEISPSPPASRVATPALISPVKSPAVRAVGGGAAGGVQKAPSTRRCSRCNAFGHQANSKKCTKKPNQSLSLSPEHT